MSELDGVGSRAGELGVRVAVVAGVIATSVLLSRAAAPLVRRLLARGGRPSRTLVLTALFRVVVVIVGSLAALTLVFPSVRVADVLAIFGILSVAAGFAFKDTFENLLAGVILLLRDPFKSGDEVTLGEVEGTVEGVTVRETLVRDHDGRLHHVPNAQVMRGVITVDTDASLRRQSVVVRLPADTQLPPAREALTAALRLVDGVESSPPQRIVITDIDAGDLVLECRYWTGSHRSMATTTRDEAIEAIVASLRRSDIDLPVDEIQIRLPAGQRPGSI